MILPNSVPGGFPLIAQNRLPLIASRFSNGVSFDGANNRVADCVFVSAPGTGDFCYEGFGRTSDASGTRTLLDTQPFTSSSAGIWIGTNVGQIRVWTSGAYLGPGPAYPINFLFHWAVTRSGTSLRIFVNGTLGATFTLSANLTNTRVNVGATSGASSNWLGDEDEIRITNGNSRYTANFTAPSAAFGENTTDDPLWNNVVALWHMDAYAAATVKGVAPVLGRFQQFAPPAFSRAGFSVMPLLFKRDYGGRGRVYGTVKIKAVTPIPVARKVRLIRDIDGVCLEEKMSDPVTGFYEFIGYDLAQKYTVLTYDHTNNYRAVVADNLTPEAM